ncbi:hypothetical protein PTKIN_Ptkin01aG0369000 [Pterospermum kingtungense]
MGPQDFIDILLLEIGLETERQEMRRMEESLRESYDELLEKDRERSMLKSKNQEMLAEEAAKEKLVDDFMAFIEAAENKDPENAQNFDEKAMMGALVTMMNSGGGGGGGAGKNGAFTGGYGDGNVLGIDLGLAEQATMDAIAALVNGAGNFGSYEGEIINNAPENALNLGDEAVMAAAERANSDGSGGDTGGDGDKFVDDGSHK